MAWIRWIDEHDATGELKELFARIAAKRGKVANIMKVQGLNPPAMKAHLDLYMALMYGPSGLSREEREMLATVVSAANGCDYCVKHHSEALNFHWSDPARVAALATDSESVELSEKARRMIEYALQLTRSPATITLPDIEMLRACGFSDAEILNINLIVAYFNFVNRIASGLGVEATADEAGGYRY